MSAHCDGCVEYRDGVLLVHADWVHPDAWFWECGECQCAFGPLVVREAAVQQADEHINECHAPAVGGTSCRATDAVPEGTTVGELETALLRGAEGDRARMAAVELLMAHRSGGRPGHWLRREPFRRLVAWYPADDVYPAAAAVDWLAVEELLASGEGLFDTGSERAMLAVAVSLARGALYHAASSCDEPNRAVIVETVARAFGVRL